MAILINNGVQNILGTPGAISGVFSDRPAAPDLAEGTLYFSTDTATIYQTVLGVWVTYAGGGGGSSVGINGLNGTATIGLGGTLLNATAIDAASFELDFNNVKVFTVVDDKVFPTAINFGDGIFQTTYTNAVTGIKLDFNAKNFYFGDFYNNKGLLLTSAGSMFLNAYGSGTQTGTAAYSLSIDSSGQIIETPVVAGGVSSVTGSLPLSSTGGANPNISISQAGIATNGYLSSVDWNTFNNKIGGSGVATRVAFWSATNAVTSNANLYWDNLNSFLSIKRATPLFNLDVNGTARIGFLEFNTTGNAATTGQGIKVIGTDKTFQLQGSAAGDINTMFKFAAYISDSYKISLTNTDSGIIRIYSGFNLPNTNNLSGNVLWITPEYDFSANLFTGIKARGIYYNPTVISLLGATNIAFESTSGDVIMFDSGVNGFKLDFTNFIFDLGDNAIGNCVRVNNPSGAIEINGNTQISMLASNGGFFATGDETIIGDVDNRNNNTFFGVNDNGSKLFGSSNLLTNIGAPTTDRIKINIGGIEYLLVLERA